MYKLYRTIPIGERSNYIDKWGEFPREPMREIHFVNTITGQIFKTNDLLIKKFKRHEKLERLYYFYYGFIFKKKVSTVLYVVNVKRISSISIHIKNIKKKLARKRINLLAYYWQRDIGDNEFEPHYHCIFVISRIDIQEYEKLFKGYNKCDAKAELCNSLRAFTLYLNKKEFFAPYKKRNNSLSKKMLKP
jgi:hypothetical protein